MTLTCSLQKGGIMLTTLAILHLCAAVFHILFWKLFNWRESLRKLSPVNRSTMQVLNICLIFVFVAVGYLLLFHQVQLTYTALGKAVLICISAFWVMRAILQPIFYPIKHIGSILLLIICIIMALLSILPVLQQL